MWPNGVAISISYLTWHEGDLWFCASWCLGGTWGKLTILNFGLPHWIQNSFGNGYGLCSPSLTSHNSYPESVRSWKFKESNQLKNIYTFRLRWFTNKKKLKKNSCSSWNSYSTSYSYFYLSEISEHLQSRAIFLHK